MLPRSSSADDGASYSIPGLELDNPRADSGKRSFARDEPLQGEKFCFDNQVFICMEDCPLYFNITLFIQPFVFPLDQGLRNVASDGNFPETWDLETGQFLCINI